MNNQTSTPQNSRSNLPGWDLKDLYSGIDDPQIKKDLEAVSYTHLTLPTKLEV